MGNLSKRDEKAINVRSVAHLLMRFVQRFRVPQTNEGGEPKVYGAHYKSSKCRITLELVKGAPRVMAELGPRARHDITEYDRHELNALLYKVDSEAYEWLLSDWLSVDRTVDFVTNYDERQSWPALRWMGLRFAYLKLLQPRMEKETLYHVIRRALIDMDTVLGRKFSIGDGGAIKFKTTIKNYTNLMDDGMRLHLTRHSSDYQEMPFFDILDIPVTLAPSLSEEYWLKGFNVTDKNRQHLLDVQKAFVLDPYWSWIIQDTAPCELSCLLLMLSSEPFTPNPLRTQYR